MLSGEDKQLRMECLKLAVAQTLQLGGDAIDLAMQNFAFVTGATQVKLPETQETQDNG